MLYHTLLNFRKLTEISDHIRHDIDCPLVVSCKIAMLRIVNVWAPTCLNMDVVIVQSYSEAHQKKAAPLMIYPTI
jgi:hypothetical protein